jgi:hypothetical protein
MPGEVYLDAARRQAVSFCMHATFRYEQQVQLEQEAVLRCLQAAQMHVGVVGHSRYWAG